MIPARCWPDSGDRDTYVVSYEYDALGRQTKETRGGQSRQWFFDSHGQVRKQTYSSLGIETRTVYDLGGNVKEVTEVIDRSPLRERVTTYYRDLLGREI